jgi:hypothetical protein
MRTKLNFLENIKYLYLSKIKKLSDCEILGHHWKCNFSTVPSKRICTVCKKRETFDLKKLEWSDKTFEDPRTDEQLIISWVEQKY